jgi:hypothetical protein
MTRQPIKVQQKMLRSFMGMSLGYV